ncbi:PaaI family thioesterase [Nocardioides sp.]|uniref:PaaI family thioesterase n=1 Tax=Nocardioides sp. TaxID=35761 RepID=UPI0035179EE8
MVDLGGFVRDDLTDAEIEREAALYGPLTDAVRGLVDATIRTTVDDDEIRAVTAEVEALTARLRARQLPGAFGVRYNPEGRGRPWGNSVVGLRNPIAPPVRTVHHPDHTGEIWTEFHLGAAYEGPPGHVHGGVLALILDQLLGESAGSGRRPGMTGTLTIRYHRATPLGALRGEARIERTEGIKTYAVGTLADADGVTVEAQGVFILPRWARERMERDPDAESPRYFE